MIFADVLFIDGFLFLCRLDVVLDSPVVVLPRASNSLQVFVAHLGKISISNNSPGVTNGDCKESDLQARLEYYDIEVRDMNLFSLDTSSRRVPGPM